MQHDTVAKYTFHGVYFFHLKFRSLNKTETHQAVLEFLETFTTDYGLNDSLDLLIVNQLWLVGRNDESVVLFALCVEKDREKAKET